MNLLIILPQALKLVIPGIANTLLALVLSLCCRSRNPSSDMEKSLSEAHEEKGKESQVK